MKGQLRSADQAKPAKRQHKSPCADCPFARIAIRGWLGNMGVGEWLQAVHGESLIDCHTVSNQQCAGAAIYRANMCKLPRSSDILVLKPNRTIVFASPMEFRAHHEKG